jgi:hypothetical protein
MSEALISVIISLFTIILYIGLAGYVLKKNPHERTNQIFVLLMLSFIIWSVATNSIGLTADNTPLSEMLLYMKLHFSGVVIGLTLFVLFALSLTGEKKFLQNPLTYIILLPSLYLLTLIWAASISDMELSVFKISQSKQDFFLYSAIFGIAGVYLLLKHYAGSRYMQQEQAKIISTGAMLSILVAVAANIILPMYYGIYFLPLSTLAPALMGVFFSYAVYQYGLFVTPVPEISVTSFCGIDCTLCQEYLSKHCYGCRFNSGKYKNCGIYACLKEKGYRDCGDCNEIAACLKRKDISGHCFVQLPAANEKPKPDFSGTHYLGHDEGFDLFIKTLKTGAYGFVVSTTNPQEIREKHGLLITPISWISNDGFDNGVKFDDLKRLSVMTINFMKRADNAVVLLDGIDTLISKNGFGKVQPVVQVISSAAQATNSALIISTNLDKEELSRLKPLYFSKKNSKFGRT